MFICMLAILNLAYAVDIQNDDKNYKPTSSKYANWIFLGTVENELGEVYNYFFQMQRNLQNFHAKVALFNSQTKELVFKEDSEAVIENESNFKWLVGQAFLRYYKTSNSWVFGLKTTNKQGFNFKVSMLNKPEYIPSTRYFKDGVLFIVTQAGNLNGHISTGDEAKDQFVTSKNTWFMQTWIKKEPNSMQNLSSLLCGFNDGRGLYSIRSLDSENENNNGISGLFDSEGKTLRISQFINIAKNKEKSDWDIVVPTPKMKIKLSDSYKETDVIAGFMTNETVNGFCLLSNEQIGKKSDS